MSLEHTIERLEVALAQGRLAGCLAAADPVALGPQLDALYHGLLQVPAPGTAAARRPWVRLALARYREALAPPRRTFVAEPAPGGLTVQGQPLTEDQALRARAWGVAFEGESSLRDRLLVQAERAARARLYQDLRGVPLIAAAVPEPPEALGEDGLGAALERLVCDALATRWSTRAAPLVEDVLQATDLRVRVPGGPNQGVRVQVAAALEGPRHAKKAAQAARAGVVLLSPLTLAEAVDQHPAAARRYPGSLPSRARLIRDALTTAIKRATADARGPVAQLPQELIEVMAAVVEAGAGLRGRHRLRWPALGERPPTTA